MSGRAGRDLDLPAAPTADTAVVSALEAGKALPPSPIHQVAHRSLASLARRMANGAQSELAVPKALPMPGAAPSLVAASEQIPVAPMPMGESQAEGQPASTDNGYRGLDAHRPVGSLEPYHRDPVIIIRGGMGGIEDKCDLRPRGGRGGIAINRMTPPMGGGGIR